MRVGEHIHLGQIGQGSVHDRKLGPIVVVDDAQEAEEVIATHPGQVTSVDLGREWFEPPFYVTYGGPKGCADKPQGPFKTTEEAYTYAAKMAGFKKAPLDGWVQLHGPDGRVLVMV